MELNNRFLIIFMAACFFSLTGSALAQDADMTGTWRVMVQSDTDSGTLDWILQQKGSEITGTYKGRFGEAPITGSVEGDDFKLVYSTRGTSNTYKGTVQDSTISGTAAFGGMMTMDFNGGKQ